MRDMTVYLDIVWLLNFFIDLLLLKLTAIFLKRTLKIWRLLVGSFVASFIVLLLFTPLSPIFFNPIGKLLYSMGIILSTFGFRRFRLFFQSLLTFYFVSFLIGGGLFAVHYFLQSSQSYAQMLASRTMSFGDPISWMLVFIGFPVLWIFSKKRLDHMEVRKVSYKERARVIIKIDGKEIETVGIVDSGNKLYDPLSHSPVMFISQAAGAGVIPEALFEKGQDPTTLFNDEQNSIPDDWQKRMAIIPYRGIGGGSQFVLGIKPDEVIINQNNKSVKCKKVMIALTQHQLSAEKDFDCILHPDLLIKGEIIQSAS